MASKPQKKSLSDAAEQISRTLRDMGVKPEDPVVERIGSEFRLLFCGEVPEAQMQSRPSSGRSDPIKSISDLLRERALEAARDTGGITPDMAAGSSRPPQRHGAKPRRRSPGSRMGVALRQLAMRCAEPILSRLRDYFVAPLTDRAEPDAWVHEIEQSVENLAERLVPRMQRIERSIENLAECVSRLESQSGSAKRLAEQSTNRNVLFLGDEILVRTPGGYVLASTDDQAWARTLVRGGAWGEGTVRLFDLTLKEGMTCVDVGAHVGVYTLYCARRVGPSGTVIAFEPAPKLFKLLERSVHLNGVHEVCRCVHMSLSSSQGAAKLHVESVDPNGSRDRRPDEQERFGPQVRTASLDCMLQDAKRVDVVNIDVAGAELDVLEGMEQTLAKHPDIVLVVEYGAPHLRRAGISPSEWFRRFFAHGFAVFALDEQAGTWRQVPAEETSQLPSTKVVFVRPGSSQWAILKTHEA